MTLFGNRVLADVTELDVTGLEWAFIQMTGLYKTAMCRHKNIKIGGKGHVTKQDTAGVVQIQR